ncbi:hypothetical protein B0H17DRAFT_1324313 [Mycena rosella]|uniref:Uncharacterized protein n=1 Tax=Mycena rosella TaxID=1033263 RepID=A0AAD7H2H4_MYCRO|nr:hypothetical protein B0H17DRAFT_1324313 [Mycena rosella]
MSDADDHDYVEIFGEERLIELGDFLRATRAQRERVSPNITTTVYSTFDQDELYRYLTLINSGIKLKAGEPDTPLILEVDANAHRVAECKTFRDVDSVIAISRDMPWKDVFDVFTTVKTIQPIGTMHFLAQFTDEVGENFARDPGEDPACWWGLCGPSGRYAIYLMLPNLGKDEEETVPGRLYEILRKYISDEEEGMAPAMLPKFDDEKRRQKGFGRRGNPAGSGSRKSMTAERGHLLAEAMMEAVLEEEWGQAAYWLLQIRGAKDLTRHQVGDRNSYGRLRTVQQELDELLREVRVDNSQIYVDVGLEVHAADPKAWGVLPLRDGHIPLLSQMFDIPDDDWVNAGVFSLDTWAGLRDIAGGRWNLAKRPLTDYEIGYIQWYVSDKAPLYNTSLRNKTPKMGELSVMKLMDPEDDMPFLFDVYSNLLSACEDKMPVVSRLEVRVPYAEANDVLRSQVARDSRNFTGTIAVVPLEYIWAWRLEKMMGLITLFRACAAAPPTTRTNLDHLKLVAAGTYSMNLLFRTPQSFSWDRMVCKAVFPCESLDQRRRYTWKYGLFLGHDSWSVPVLSHGALWLPRLLWPEHGETNILRFAGCPMILDRQMIEKIFKTDFLTLERLYMPIRKVVPRGEGGTMVRNVRGPREIEPRTNELPGSFGLPRPQLPYDHGFDLQTAARTGRIPSPERDNATHIFVAILVEAFQGVGMKTDGTRAYCRLPLEQRALTGVATFKDRNLLTYFDWGYISFDPKDWSKTADLLFPNPMYPAKHADKQGWKQQKAFQVFINYQGKTGTDLHKFCRQQFDKLDWFIYVQVDRLIDYRPRGLGWTRFGKFDPNDAKGVAIVWRSREKPDLFNKQSRAVLDPEAVEREEKRRRLAKKKERNEAGDNASDSSRESSPENDLCEVRPRVLAPAVLAEIEASSRLVRGRMQVPRERSYRDYPDPPRSLLLNLRQEEEEESASDG